jgi:hypothetical protein
MKTVRISLFLLPLLLFLSACGDTPKKAETTPKEPEKVEPVTGRTAFQKMYVTARTWAPDAEILRVQSIKLEDVPPEPGKAGAWEALFVSQTLGRARSYTFAVTEGPGNIRKGVFAGPEQSYSPRGITRPFVIAALKIDSSDALEVATKEGAEYAKKNPDMNILYLLEATREFPNPAWRVVWGESVGTSGFSIYVDATTGKFLKRMR